MTKNQVLQIRPATYADAQSIADFNAAMAFETERKRLDPDVVLSGVRCLLATPDSGFYVVAELPPRVIGCLMVTFEWSDWRNGNFWWIQSVYVEPPQRRSGVFRRLYEHVLQAAQQRPDVCGLRLYVEQDNAIARQTYHRLGMTETPYRLYEKEFDYSIRSE